MIKMLIADDEPIIIKGIQKLLPWEEMGIDRIGEACNGREAVVYIRNHQPDLIISDIQMPGLSGIDMLKFIHEEKRNIPVIFISGYQDFSYAKEAIHYGALDYLLKPVKKEALKNAVEKALAQIRQTGHMEKLQSHAQAEEVKYIIQEAEGESSGESVYARFDALGWDLRGKRYMGVSVRLLEAEGEDNELARFAIFSRAEEFLREQAGGFKVEQDQNEVHYILAAPAAVPISDLEACAAALPELIEREYGQKLIVGIGSHTEALKELRHIGKASRFALDLYFFLEQDIIRYQDIDKKYTLSFEDYSEAYRNMVNALVQNRGEPIHELNKCLDIIRELHFGNRLAAIHRCHMLVSEIFAELQDYFRIGDRQQEEKEHFIAHMQECLTYRELKNEVTAMMRGVTNLVRAGVKKNTSYTIKELKDYMHAHYMENLTLEKMADIACMNPYYFSSYFKKETGQNFKGYLTDIRMREAWNLVMTTEMKAYEIAEAVGYGNVRQFSDKFKVYYGKSPLELRRERGN